MICDTLLIKHESVNQCEFRLNLFDEYCMAVSKKQKHFQSLTRPWRDRLYAVALRYGSDQQTAEDWTQETLLRAWRDFKQLNDDITVYAWLLKILDHVIADDTRRKNRRQKIAPMVAVDDDYLQTHSSANPEPFEQLLQQQTSEQLLDAIHKLPDEFGRVIVLKDIEGFAYKEIASILEIPKGTVMSRLSRGRRMLSVQLIKSNRPQKNAINNVTDIAAKKSLRERKL